MAVTTATGPAHASDPAEVVHRLATDDRAGLSETEAARRLSAYGRNALYEAARPRYAAIAARQVVDPLVALLVVAAAVSAALGETVEAVTIAAIVVLNAGLGFAQEVGAERAITALRDAFPRSASVVRGGLVREVPADEVVPGDVVVLREGDAIPADARLLEAIGLEVDESALTGESLPVEKHTDRDPAGAALAERPSMVFAGTGVVRGRGRGVVTGTGGGTELGAIASLTGTAAPPPTPLQTRLGRLARVLALAGVGLTLALGGAMLARGSSLHEAFLTGVSVAVAAVPEGLLATVTIALALGAGAMAGRGAIVRRLGAIETIGETTLACVDKTGTLTENRLRVAAVEPVDGSTIADVLAAAALASNAELVEEEDGSLRVAGDPIEGALLLAALEHGLSRRHLLESRSLVAELPFSPGRRRMTVVYEDEHGRHAFTKGAPEQVLELAAAREADRDRLGSAAEAWARKGFRVLGVAGRRLAEDDVDDAAIERDLLPVGLVALHDPLRAGAADAVATARAASVDVWMLTGDHPATAHVIGGLLDLEDESIHARVTPAEKLAIVEAAQANGDVVLVTGDGVNDAPALRQADVGVAMGRGGTEAAREAADIVLVDDAFETIVAAIREGRRIADNIRKVVAFLLSANLGEVVLFALAVTAGLGVPMAVVQVLTINVLTDGLPALALARDPVDPDAMSRPPRARGTFFPPVLVAGLVVAGVLVGLAGLAAYLAGGGTDGASAQTMAFATVALAELAFVFSCRSERLPAWKLAWNPQLGVSVLASAGLVALVVYAPVLSDPFSTVPLDAREVAIVLGLALVPTAGVELAKALLRLRLRLYHSRIGVRTDGANSGPADHGLKANPADEAGEEES
jgi:Ca2+-transporting ATPase